MPVRYDIVRGDVHPVIFIPLTDALTEPQPTPATILSPKYEIYLLAPSYGRFSTFSLLDGSSNASWSSVDISFSKNSSTT